MASAGYALRAHFEGLLTGASGTGYTLAADRFHLVAQDESVDTHPAHSIERACEVVLEAGEPFVERNPYDGFDFVRFALRVRIGYALTHAGGDLVEGLTEQHGAATTSALRDRALTDALDVVRVLTWPDNRGSVDPTIIAVIAEEAYELDLGTDRAVLTIPFRLDTRVTTTGAYAP